MRGLLMMILSISLLIFLLTGCSGSGSSDDLTGSENRGTCMDGFLCDSSEAGDDIKIEDYTAEQSVNPGSGAEIRAGESVTVKISPEDFAGETTFQVIRGFSIDDLGVTENGESNETAIGNAPEMSMFFEIAELVFTREKLAGSVELTMEYSRETIDSINVSLTKEYPGIPLISENDLGVYYFDKGRGEFTLCKYNIDSANRRFVLNTQIPGIYILALKPETYLEMNAFFESNPSAAKAAQKKLERTAPIAENNETGLDTVKKSRGKVEGEYGVIFDDKCSIKKINSPGGLSPDGYPKEPPDSDRKIYETNCSGGPFGYLGPYAHMGDKPCYYHDFC